MPQPHDAGATQSRYSAVAILLHWTIAALLLTNLVLGLQSGNLKGLAQFSLLQWHKSLGITVLLLSVTRLAWRLVHRPPPYPPGLGPWERAAAGAVHWGFYILMLGLPLTGWIMVSASPTNIPTLLYKTIPWPHLGLVHALPMATRKNLDDLFGDIHATLAWTAIGLIALHVAAAIKHQVWSRDLVLWRMAPLPGLAPGRSGSEDA